MDPRLLHYYNNELQHLREMAVEFAKEYPKIAARLDIKEFEVQDPYVERLLEGFSYLAARVQLRLDAEFPQFTQHLLEMVYPNYLAPLPSMAVAQFEPNYSEGSLAEGVPLPRQTVLRTVLGRGEQTPCEYRTAHDLKLWPIELVDAEYFTHARGLGDSDSGALSGKAGIRLRLKATAGTTFDKLPIDSLPVFLQGTEDVPGRIYEQIVADVTAAVIRPVDPGQNWSEVLRAEQVRPIGFDDDEALLPYGARSFQGYRLLQEYFAFPQRYLFVEFTGLRKLLARHEATEIDLMVLFKRSDPSIENGITKKNFGLYCTPVINLFSKRADRIHLDSGRNEYQLVIDRTKPMDFEVFDVLSVKGHGTGAEPDRDFRRFYSCDDFYRGASDEAYFTVRREPRLESSIRKDRGRRASYESSDTFLSIVDSQQAPFSPDLRQLSARVMATNRDLPLQLVFGTGKTDFTVESGAPVGAVRCVAGPTRPRPSHAGGRDVPWRLISHLSLNYLSLTDDTGEGANALRELLTLYADTNDRVMAQQIEGLHSVKTRPITRRIPGPGPMAFGRGLEITLACDDAAFQGSGAFLLGAVLDRFFAKYVSINSFTQTVLRTSGRGEIMRWPLRAGRRPVL